MEPYMDYISSSYHSRGALSRKMAYEVEGRHVVKRNHGFGHFDSCRGDLLCCHNIRGASISYYTLSPPVTINIRGQ